MSASAVVVLGQGIAGTLVSFRLRQAGIPHVVVDRGHASASSYAAAGLVNPVTGRRFVAVADYEAYRAGFAVYDALAEALGSPWVYPLTIYRDLADAEQVNRWDQRRGDPHYRRYLAAPVSLGPEHVPPPLAGERFGPTLEACRVDLPGLVSAYRERLRSEGALRELDIGGVEDLRAGRTSPIDRDALVIDCRGAGSGADAAWGHLPWRLSHGQALRIAGVNDYPRSAFKRRFFLSATGAGGSVWVGATSSDRYGAPDEWNPDRAEALEDFARAHLGVLPPTTERLAAVRPTMCDRRVRVEVHPRDSRLLICGGLGTKGALYAPEASARCLALIRERLADVS